MKNIILSGVTLLLAAIIVNACEPLDAQGLVDGQEQGEIKGGGAKEGICQGKMRRRIEKITPQIGE